MSIIKGRYKPEKAGKTGKWELHKTDFYNKFKLIIDSS